MTDINHRAIQANNINLHIAEAGDGPPVVLCHGFPESWYSWRHQIPVLADAGFRVVAPDQRGYGDSDAPESVAAYSILHLTGDIVALVHALGEDQAVVVGHDWGSPVAWALAQMRPDMFRAVASLSVPFTGRGAWPPINRMRQHFGDRFFYQIYFQTPGRRRARTAARHPGHDAQDALRRLGGDRALRWFVRRRRRTACVLLHAGAHARPGRRPATMADRGGCRHLRTGLHHVGVPRRPQLVPEHRPQLGTNRRVRPHEDRAASAVRSRRPGRSALQR